MFSPIFAALFVAVVFSHHDHHSAEFRTVIIAIALFLGLELALIGILRGESRALDWIMRASFREESVIRDMRYSPTNDGYILSLDSDRDHNTNAINRLLDAMAVKLFSSIHLR